MTRLALLAALVTVAVAACGPKLPPTAVTPNDAIILVHSNVHDAEVYVDGRFVGPLGFVRRGIAMDPGRHRVELRHDAYFSRYVELDLHRAEHKRLELEMAPVLP